LDDRAVEEIERTVRHSLARLRSIPLLGGVNEHLHLRSRKHFALLEHTSLNSLTMRIAKRDFFGPTLNFLSSTDNAFRFGLALVTDIAIRLGVSLDSSAAVCMG
jgi:hypothetical protein